MSAEIANPAPLNASRLILAGLAGEAVFEFLALVLAPALLGQAMMPAMLVGALSQGLFGSALPPALAWAGHLLAGIVLFPLGYVLVARALAPRPWPQAAAIWAVALWAVAQGVLAPLAGRPFMLGFIPYTWASLAVHVTYVFTVALAWQRLARRAAAG